MMEYLCIDVGGTRIKYAVITDDYAILDYNVKPAKWQNSEDFLACVEAIFYSYRMGLSGIAISYCGELDPHSGVLLTGGMHTFNTGLDLKGELEARCGVPVSVENDGNCAALAEFNNGALKGVENGAVLVIGTGLSLAPILGGKLYRGSHFFAGASSFAMTDVKGPLDWSNVQFALSGARFLPCTYEQCAGLEEGSLDGEAFFAKANAGDKTAISVLREYAHSLAAYIYNLQIILDLDVIALGGGISAQPLLRETVGSALKQMMDGFPIPIYRPELRVCKYFNDANLLGALYAHLNA